MNKLIKLIIFTGIVGTSTAALPVLAEEGDSRRDRIFDRVDRNDDGRIGAHERDRARYMRNRLDVNDDGKVGHAERHYARHARNAADKNNDGRLGRQERHRLGHKLNRVDRRH